MSDDYFGPPLPPSLNGSAEKRHKIYRATLPNEANYSNSNSKQSNTSSSDESGESEESEESEESVEIGPTLTENYKGINHEDPLDNFLSRPTKIDHSKVSKSKLKREEWMTKPPERFLSSAAGLSKRTFKSLKSYKNEDDSEEKVGENKIITPEGSKTNSLLKDIKYDEIVENYNNLKRPKTLVQMKNDEIKEKKTEKAERKPFNRDTDLNIGASKYADTNKLAESATKGLGGRFASSSNSKYL